MKSFGQAKGIGMAMAAMLSLALLGGCAGNQAPQSTETETSTQEATTESAQESAIDYKALVNKTHELPAGWEDAISIVSFKNTEDWDVDVEEKAYDAYLGLKEDLENEGVYVDLDSAYRSIEEQQRIVDDFTEKYGEEYVKKYVAVPGYSEHHTGLALDLFLIIDGKGVYMNEDMVKYPEIWDKIHAKLADHGFILRYLPEKKIETGYSYEPWHIRYIDDVDAAHEIMDKGITYERYLGELDPITADCAVDYGTSELYGEPDIDGAIDPILAEFSTWEGCTLKSLAFTDDATCEKELESANALRDEGTEEFTQALVMTSSFHSPSAEAAEGTAWEPDTDYEDWTWLLARRSSEDGWELLTWGQG